MVIIFQILAVILAGVAAYLLWIGNNDWFFLSAVCACAAFFLSIRFQIKERLNARDAERLAAEEAEE